MTWRAFVSKYEVLNLIFTSLQWIRNRYRVTVNWPSSAKILLSSALTAVLTYTIIAQLSFASWIRLVIGVAIFLPAFIAATLLTRTINRTDISNLREMLSALSPLRRLFNRLLDLVEKLMITLRLYQKTRKPRTSQQKELLFRRFQD